jgi:hypothetical protein
MRAFHLTLIFVSLATFARADWRHEVFLEAQQLMRTFERTEAEYMEGVAPHTAEFFSLSLPLSEARRRIERIAFERRVENDPGSIKWDNPWVWSDGIKSTKEEKLLAESDAEFAEAYKDYLVKGAALRERLDLFELRNAAYKAHKEKISEFEAELQASMDALQKRVDELKR